eukprot:CAMPEP_0173399602 /NCGR_PEP_ID=MMETSP1356-20130122/45458_1 /TAXON_ID=77927 ORGANISM="Hemiselmis virescens, Strain PCC157" /NCGR_SAMPLE_ID=MMETSP1356 /ASSEMBLY_ACC=CAM_ASM_000847 /LENGTH=122 /DNA_ID=CAMNT_0014359349 /DNA_START=89 /DNA_END=454 /DNA_ORIENTATION=-
MPVVDLNPVLRPIADVQISPLGVERGSDGVLELPLPRALPPRDGYALARLDVEEQHSAQLVVHRREPRRLVAALVDRDALHALEAARPEPPALEPEGAKGPLLAELSVKTRELGQQLAQPLC